MNAGMNRLVADLGKAPKEVFSGAQTILEAAAFKIKDELRSEVQASPSLRAAARSVSYDSKASLRGLRVEVGFDKMISGGPLGNIFEFGVKSPQGAMGGGKGALQAAVGRELPAVDKHFNDLLGRVL